MPYERVPRSDAGRWTTLLGFALALIAAGSFIAFSLVARDASTAGLDAPVAAVAPVASAPAITFARTEGRDARSGPDGVRLSGDGRDLVLGTRFLDGPITTPGTTTTSTRGDTSGGCTSRCGGGTQSPDTQSPPDPAPARVPDQGSYQGGNKGKPASAGPSPKGKANGHEKARGKGHDKHPGDG
jgi:hypothetical protein